MSAQQAVAVEVLEAQALPAASVKYFTSTAAPLPTFHDLNAQARVGLQNQRQVMLKKFGWKASYGPLVPQPEGDKRRAKAERAADDWFFAQLGRATMVGQRYLAMREYYEMAKVDMGWKLSYGALVPKAKGDAKRAKAEEKALRYTADKFGEDESAIASWVIIQ